MLLDKFKIELQVSGDSVAVGSTKGAKGATDAKGTPLIANAPSLARPRTSWLGMSFEIGG